MTHATKLSAVLVVMILTALACGTSSTIEVKPPADAVISEDQASNGSTSSTSASGADADLTIGTSRSNPAPAGSEVLSDDMAFIITDAIRPATDIVLQGSRDNVKPEEGREYVFVLFKVTCMKPEEEICAFNPFISVSLIGSSGIKYDYQQNVLGVDLIIDSVEFYGGATVEGYVPFIISEDEMTLMIIYEPLILGDPFYLTVPET